jgi:lincosamide nucleotidyltransferase
MLPQEGMIERLRQICEQDERVVAAMLYGSFSLQEADQFSDIDCILFFEDDALGEVDQKAWVAQIAPVELYYKNEFGNGVAIFDNLVRAEFHFDPASTMDIVKTWRDGGSYPSVEAALLVDRSGRLTQNLKTLTAPPPRRNTPEMVEHLCQSFLNWILFGSNVLARGERARALEILTLVHDYLLRMARLEEGATRHWMTPTRLLERELSPQAYARFVECTATVEQEALESAYWEAWRWGNEMMQVVSGANTVALPTSLIKKLDHRLARQFSKKM